MDKLNGIEKVKKPEYAQLAQKLFEEYKGKGFISSEELDKFLGENSNKEELLKSIEEQGFVFHGSSKFVDNTLEIRQAEDLSTDPKNKQNGIYATNIPSVAMYMAIISPEKTEASSMTYGMNMKYYNGKVTPIFSADQNMDTVLSNGYVYILNKSNFEKLSEDPSEWQFISKENIKPDLIVEVLPKDFNHEIIIKENKH